MKTNLERVRDDLEKMAGFNGTPGQGCTRFSYSREDVLAREYLMAIFKDLELDVRVDAIGNIRARYEGLNPKLPVVMIGSHIDTVRNGGNFDGVLGVVAAVEVLRVLKENAIKTRHSIEAVVFAEEEGSNFGTTMVGSKVLVGQYDQADLEKLKNSEGRSCYDVVKSFGLNLDELEKSRLKDDEVKAMLEMHIEQSVVLDNEKATIGIVEAIAGMKTFKVSVQGQSNHAGATPMNLRVDPMVGAAEIIMAIETIAREKTFDTTVATVGQMHCSPNVSNVIAFEVSFSIDVRDVKKEGIDIAVKEIEQSIEKIKSERNLVINMELVGQSDSIALSSEVADLIEETAEAQKINYKRMNSGAVHDAALLAGITRVGMIFVPSINGRSHVPEELTRYEDIQVGCDLLLGAVLKIAN